jgi:hypothetical protein
MTDDKCIGCVNVDTGLRTVLYDIFGQSLLKAYNGPAVAVEEPLRNEQEIIGYIKRFGIRHLFRAMYFLQKALDKIVAESTKKELRICDIGAGPGTVSWALFNIIRRNEIQLPVKIRSIDPSPSSCDVIRKFRDYIEDKYCISIFDNSPYYGESLANVQCCEWPSMTKGIKKYTWRGVDIVVFSNAMKWAGAGKEQMETGINTWLRDSFIKDSDHYVIIIETNTRETEKSTEKEMERFYGLFKPFKVSDLIGTGTSAEIGRLSLKDVGWVDGCKIKRGYPLDYRVRAFKVRKPQK